jgi:hypothetical protein
MVSRVSRLLTFSVLSYYRSAQVGVGPSVRHSDFRSNGSPLPFSGPPTGLSVLMGTNYKAPPVSAFSTMTTMNRGEQHQARETAEIEDRELQAAALASAGMVADSFRMSQGLQPPPMLATYSSTPPTRMSNEIDCINWSAMDTMTGTMHVDDMDLDFASLFDPAQELANMHTEGSGWPKSSSPDPSLAVSPTPLGKSNGSSGGS